MYASITYTAAANRDNVFNDIIALLTGTTVVGSLSADVIGAGSEIISTTPAGWTIHSTVIANESAILKAPISDDGTKHKYVHLTAYTYSDFDYIIYELYEEQDTPATITKKKVNSTSTDYAYPNSVSSSAGKNAIYINNSTNAHQSMAYLSASTNHIAAKSSYNEGYVDTIGPNILSEHTRDSAWDTVLNGFNPTVISSGSWSASFYNTATSSAYPAFMFPEISDGAGGVTSSQVNSSNCYGAIITPVGTTMRDGISGSQMGWNDIIDENGYLTDALIPFGVAKFNVGNIGGNISSKSNIYLGYLGSMPNDDDVFVHNANNYRVWRIYQSHTNGLCLLIRET